MERKYSGFSIVSFVLGLCSLFLFWIPILGLVIPILAVIFGFVALSKIKKNSELQGKGLAIAGLVLGFTFLIISLILSSVLVSWWIIGNRLDISKDTILNNIN